MNSRTAHLLVWLRDIAVVAAVVCYVTACSASPAVDIAGTWQASVTYEQELSKSRNDDIPLAVVRIQQENTFIFNADGTYSRTVGQRFVSARSFSPEVAEADVAALYEKQDASITLSGTYTLKGTRLVLHTLSAANAASGEVVPYTDFYKTVQAYGAPDVKTRLRIASTDSIVLQGIAFKRID